MLRRRVSAACVVLLATAASAGCKNKQPYMELAAAGPHVAFMAPYAEVLSDGVKPDAPEGSMEIAGLARDRILERAKQATNVSLAKATPDTTAALEKLRALEAACAKPAKEGAEETAAAVKSCSGALEALKAALAAAREGATQQGVAADTMPALDAARAPEDAKKGAADLRAAVTPDAVESRVLALWPDEKATDAQLEAACKEFARVHGYKSKGKDDTAKTDSDDWMLSLMLLKDPLLASLDGDKDPLKKISSARLRKRAQQCVVYSTMVRDAKDGDRCEKAADLCTIQCAVMKKMPETRTELRDNAQVYGPAATKKRVEKLYKVCGVEW